MLNIKYITKMILSFVIITTFLPQIISAQTGMDIAKLSYDRPEPNDMTSDLSMVLTDSKGRTRESTLHVMTQSGGEKQIIWFLAPADDRGVSFLKIEYDDKDDEMRLWLPAFKKIRRISSKKKSEAFMGSDMSYEDMTNRDLEDNEYTLLKTNEIVNEIKCYVIETKPKKELRSEYSHHISWIAKDGLYPVKEESYDRSGKLLKEKMFFSTRINDYFILTELYVENVQKNHNTRLTFQNVILDTGIGDSMFQEKNLTRIPRD
jgi:outer membrane lipoprotein-sorting protein